MARQTADSDLLKPEEFLFDVPTGLVRILDRDLQAAGIPKRDDRGRTLDVHALRTTFGTHLSKAGVSLRTAQAEMRHSPPELTANIDTDPRLLDVHGAVEALPELKVAFTDASRPLPLSRSEVGQLLGCEGNQLAPLLAPSGANLGQAESIAVTPTSSSIGEGQAG